VPAAAVHVRVPVDQKTRCSDCVADIRLHHLDGIYRLLLPGYLGGQVNDLIALIFADGLESREQGADGFAGTGWCFHDQVLAVLNAAIDFTGETALLMTEFGEWKHQCPGLFAGGFALVCEQSLPLQILAQRLL